MKTFQVVQKNLKLLGMDPNPSVSKFNAKIFGIFLLLGLSFISNCLFFMNEANNSREYIDSAYIASSVFTTSTNFLLFIWKSDELYKLMNGIENIINRRK